jgi:FAM194 protein
LTLNGGEEFNSSGARLRKWMWHELTLYNSSDDDNTRVDLPTLYPITLGVNYNCSVRIISQHNVSLTFGAERRSCRFHVGAQLRVSVLNVELVTYVLMNMHVYSPKGRI